MAVRVSVAAVDTGYILICTDRADALDTTQHYQSVVTSLDRGIVVINRDGTIASITRLLAEGCININHMEVSRADRGQTALMVIETDERVAADVIERMNRQNNIYKIITLDV